MSSRVKIASNLRFCIKVEDLCTLNVSRMSKKFSKAKPIVYPPLS